MVLEIPPVRIRMKTFNVERTSKEYSKESVHLEILLFVKGRHVIIFGTSKV